MYIPNKDKIGLAMEPHKSDVDNYWGLNLDAGNQTKWEDAAQVSSRTMQGGNRTVRPIERQRQPCTAWSRACHDIFGIL